MRSRYRFNLTSAILASLASLLLLTWLLLSIISFKTAEKDLLAARRAHAEYMLDLILTTLPEHMDGSSVSRAVAVLKAEKEYSSFLLVNRAGEILLTLADERGIDATMRGILKKPLPVSQFSPDGKKVHVYAPLLAGGNVAGAARLTLSLERDQARLARTRTLFLGYFILDFILLLGLGAFILRRVIVAPLDRLLKATERIIAGNYTHPLHVHGGAEIAGLAESFNLMQEALRRRSEEVENHVRSLEEANRALQEARQESVRAEKMASIGLLAAGMAHEIGTPLAAIIGYNGVLADELAGDEEKSDYLRRIGREADRIDRLVRDLLDYARPGKGENEVIVPEQFLADLMAMLDGQGVFKKLQVTTQLESGLPRLYLDRHKLMQVLVNLIINARDAMSGGGELRVRAYMEHGYLAIAIADSGAGILPENREKVFEPFFTTKEPGQGTGLGLAISARLVESFGGYMAVESVLHKGTTFTVWLPVGEK